MITNKVKIKNHDKSLKKCRKYKFHCLNIILLEENSLLKSKWEKKNALFEIIQLLYYFIKCVVLFYIIL